MRFSKIKANEEKKVWSDVFKPFFPVQSSFCGGTDAHMVPASIAQGHHKNDLHLHSSIGFLTCIRKMKVRFESSLLTDINEGRPTTDVVREFQ